MDSKVRVQLSPSLMKHYKNTIRFNEGLRFVKNKTENIYIFPHTILPFPFPSFPIHHTYSEDAR